MLHELAIKYGTDKAGHGYMPVYERYFEARKLEALNLLEIGVHIGASLRMWKEYFVNGQIHGIDNVLKKKELEEHRIAIHIGSQDDKIFLKATADKAWPLHIVIDDGSHMWGHQIASFETLFPMLAGGGIYCIEDLHTSYHPEFKGASKQTAIDYFKALTDDVNKHGHSYGNNKRIIQPSYYEDNIKAIHFHSNLCIIEKGEKETLKEG